MKLLSGVVWYSLNVVLILYLVPIRLFFFYNNGTYGTTVEKVCQDKCRQCFGRFKRLLAFVEEKFHIEASIMSPGCKYYLNDISNQNELCKNQT